MPPSGESLVAALRGALPWLRLYRGATFVVKLGGAALDDGADLQSLIDQIALLHALGIRVVVVHGGGVQLSRTSEALGIEVRRVEGRRPTCARTLEVATMVLNGSVRTRLLAGFREAGVRAIGVSGVDAGLIQATRRPPTRRPDGTALDWGLVGDLVEVRSGLLEDLLEDGLVVCLSPLSADEAGTVLNVNADTVAAAVAASLGAQKLLLVSDVPGILARADDPASLVVLTDLDGLDRLEAAGAVGGGMAPKLACVRAALRGGVERVHLVGHRTPDALLREVFTNEGAGTLVVREAAPAPGAC